MIMIGRQVKQINKQDMGRPMCVFIIISSVKFVDRWRRPNEGNEDAVQTKNRSVEIN